MGTLVLGNRVVITMVSSTLVSYHGLFYTCLSFPSSLFANACITHAGPNLERQIKGESQVFYEVKESFLKPQTSPFYPVSEF